MGCIDLAQGRDGWWAVVNTVMNILIPRNAGMSLNGCTTGGS
jgi:hypothetical protein